MLNFSKIVKEEREKQGMTKRELARRIGCTDRAISYWETGEKSPNITLADKVLKALEISLKIGSDKDE